MEEGEDYGRTTEINFANLIMITHATTITGLSIIMTFAPETKKW